MKMALKPLTVLLPLEAWLADRKQRGQLALPIDGSKINVIQISDADFLAQQPPSSLFDPPEARSNPREARN